MHNANIPDHTELPSTSKLIKSTIIAIIAATIILITLVLPAEYGIDPTGIGKLTGLQRMGEIKNKLALELEEESQASPTPVLNPEDDNETTPTTATEPTPDDDSAPTRTDKMSVTLAPDESTEIKLTMQEGNTVNFNWSTEAGQQVFYDLHADSKTINYHVYEKGTESTKEGTLEAAFNGNHGWYWKNRTPQPITITLNTTGTYQAIKEMN